MLCLVLDRSAVRGPLRETVSACVAAGVDRVQVRERELESCDLLALTDEVCSAAREGAARAGHEVTVVVNRRCDVALAASADGVHLGFDAVTAETARRLMGPTAEVGVSCHDPAEVSEAVGASYAHLAPVFTPLSKAAERPPLGPAALGAAAGPLPVLAQGGVEASNAGACIAAGASGVAVTGAILGADDPARAAAALRDALDRAAAR